MLPKARMTAAPLMVSEYLASASQQSRRGGMRGDPQCEQRRLSHAFDPAKLSSRLCVLPSVVAVAYTQDQEADEEEGRDRGDRRDGGDDAESVYGVGVSARSEDATARRTHQRAAKIVRQLGVDTANKTLNTRSLEDGQ